MNYSLILHYFYLFLAGFIIFTAIFDIVNYSKGFTFALYGTVVEGWYFTAYMIALFTMSGFILLMSKVNLDAHIKKHLDAFDNTL